MVPVVDPMLNKVELSENVTLSPSMSVAFMVWVKAVPITPIVGGLKLTKFGASLTGLTLIVTALLAFEERVPSLAVKVTFLMPVKFAEGVNLTMLLVLLIATVMLLTVECVKLNESPSTSKKCFDRLRPVVKESSSTVIF